MRPIDGKLLTRFVKMAGDRLRGRWIIIGGAVLPLVGVHHRVTLDIDIVGPPDAGQDQTLVLMEIAESLGLPMEAINQAGAIFLHRIEAWERNLVVVHSGKSAAIHRPDATLFILLKLMRFTESDLADCLELLKVARAGKEDLDLPRLRRAVRSASDRSPSEEKSARLRSLLLALGTTKKSSRG
jgi:hypothetical protein